MNSYDRGPTQPTDRGGATMMDALIRLDEVTKRYDLSLIHISEPTRRS